MITYTVDMRVIQHIYIYMKSLDELVQCIHYLISIHTLLYENN